MKLHSRILPVILFVIFLFIITATFSIVSAADYNSEKVIIASRALTHANIPLFQQFKIIEKIDISYDYLMNNYSGSREIVIEDALKVEIFSNADWQLRLNNRNLNAEIMIKKSNQSNDDWQKLNSTTAKFYGESGVKRINFDLKFELKPGFKSAVDNLDFDLKYSLNKKLY